MWLKNEENYTTKFLIKKEKKKDWLIFFKNNLQLKTIKTNSFDIIEKLENNFFEYYKLSLSNKHYIKMCLLVMTEENIDINSINFEKTLKNSQYDPKKILLLANIHNYRLVKESANFLHDFNPEIAVDLNNLPNKKYLHSCFNTEAFNLFKLESHKKFEYLNENNKEIIKNLEDETKDSLFTIHTEPLVNWQLLKEFTKTSENVELFLDLIKQKIIKPNLLTKELDGKTTNLFELLMLKPTNNNYIILTSLLETYKENFNLKLTYNFFDEKLNLIKENLKETKLQQEIQNFTSILKKIELSVLKKDLLENLKEKEEDSGKVTKI